MKFSRREFPKCAEFILAMRDEFGADEVQVISITENNQTIGGENGETEKTRGSVRRVSEPGSTPA